MVFKFYYGNIYALSLQIYSNVSNSLVLFAFILLSYPIAVAIMTLFVCLVHNLQVNDVPAPGHTSYTTQTLTRTLVWWITWMISGDVINPKWRILHFDSWVMWCRSVDLKKPGIKLAHHPPTWFSTIVWGRLVIVCSLTKGCYPRVYCTEAMPSH